MRFAARFFSCFIIILFFFSLVPVIPPTQVFAQTTQAVQPKTTTAMPLSVESNVPQNQHTYMQASFIELLVAIQCQLTGIDLTDPTHSCLGINMQTGKLGYAPGNLAQNGLPPMGGILGMINSGIGAAYTPAYNTNDYVKDLANNFGITKTYAAPTTAFEGLSPILGLWKMTRDIAYFLLTIAFIFIGFGVMMRVHIDPRTVMTVQNQIPRIIICIILITFSYAFAALLADVMWIVTYMGINKITETVNPASYHICGGTVPYSLAQYATTQIIQTPMSFVDDVMATKDCLGKHSGILEVSTTVAWNLSSIEWNLFLQLIGISPSDCTANGVIGAIASPLAVTPLGPPIIAADVFFNGGNIVKSATACLVGKAFGAVFQFFTNIAWFFVVVIIMIVTLFRIWFELLKAYIMVLIYIILAPLWIVFGLLPKKPLGFEKWLRAYFAHLAIFPATVFLLILARLFSQLFGVEPDSVFVPPLVGNPYVGNFGALLEFGMLLMAPTILSIIREKIGTPPLKQAQAIGQAFTAGRSAVGAVSGKTWQGLNRRNPTTGAGEAALSHGSDLAKSWAKRKLFSRGGILNSGATENAAQRYARTNISEPAENLARGGSRHSHDQLYGDTRNNPNNRADIVRAETALNKPANTRTVDEERLLTRTGLLTDDQRTQRTTERQQLSLDISVNGGPLKTQALVGNATQTSSFVLGHLDTSTAGGTQAAAEITREAATPEGAHWNKPLETLTPLERAQVQEYLTRHKPHIV